MIILASVYIFVSLFKQFPFSTKYFVLTFPKFAYHILQKAEPMPETAT